MQHIGYIMDGNRTWARAHHLPAHEGHRRGYENAKNIIKASKSLGIPYASFWALSDDNIKKRSKEELTYLFGLLERGILDLAEEAMREDICIVCIGDRSLLPETCVKNIKQAEEMTVENRTMTAIIAIGYGGQEEIVRAMNRLKEYTSPETPITRDDILAHLETSAFPPPDLIIRTGGHMRHSGFFLFQSAYTEYFFSEKNWPDFTQRDIEEALSDYKNRERKYGQ